VTSLALALARWAHGLEPAPEDLALADRSLLDTVAVALAARDHPVTRLAVGLPDGPRWAVAGHVLDFDDLHMPSMLASGLRPWPRPARTPIRRR
jgi:hypothetical protein